VAPAKPRGCLILKSNKRPRHRVVYLTENLEVGGLQNALVRLATSVPREEWDPEVWLLRPNPDKERFLAPLRDADVPVVRFPLLKWNPYTRLDKLAFFVLAWKMASRRPSIVHSFSFFPYGAEAAAAWVTRVPAYIVRHCDEVHQGSPAVWKFKYGVAKRIVVLSKRMHRVHLDENPDLAHKTVMIPNGVDVDLFAPDPAVRGCVRASLGIPRDSVVLVCVARLVKEKNQILIVRALSKLAKAVHLLLVGTGGSEDSLRREASCLGVSARVHFLGARNDIPAILNDSDIFVLASQPGGEGLPNALLEAKSMGLPAVISRGGYEEVVQHGEEGLVFEPGSVEELAHCLETLTLNHDRRRAMGLRARESALDKYSLRRTIDANVAMYRELLGKGRYVDKN
jgi:glycosyltransferase involved in cell wall biosynthesis